MTYVLEHCGARFVIAGDQEQVDKVIEVQETLHGIEHILYLDAARTAEIRPFQAACACAMFRPKAAPRMSVWPESWPRARQN